MALARDTIFSPCRTYRYTLWRTWDMFNPTFLQVIGLNPSIADEILDDNTVRRCINYAQRWGYGALCMTNIFAYRATDPMKLRTESDPVGPENDLWLLQIAQEASLILAAWGVHGAYLCRGEAVQALLQRQQLVCLGETKEGFPRHPLYMAKTCEPRLLSKPEGE